MNALRQVTIPPAGAALIAAGAAVWYTIITKGLYGHKFADEQVELEKQRGHTYPPAWESALAFTPEERAAQWKKALSEHQRR